jgi:hypothetical protein
MRQRTLASAVLAVVLTALIAGCAGPMAGAGPIVPASFDEHLVGTWNGKFWALGEFYYPIEGLMVMDVRPDHTFTVTATPTGAANNIAKPSTWSGTVTEEHGRLVLHTTKGTFPMFSSATRRGSDELYGVTNDPASGGGNIGFEFEKADRPVARGEAIVR